MIILLYTPGQYTQILPVTAMWGQRWGLAITATTAIPEAVRTGFAFNKGIRRSLYCYGIAASISTILGVEESLFFLENSYFNWFRLILELVSHNLTN